MKKSLIRFFTIIFLFLFEINSFSQEKIAFIDLNFVYANSKIGKKIIKEIESKKKNINKDFKEFKTKLEDEKKKLLAQKNVLAEDEYKKVLNLENNLKNITKLSQKNKDLVDYQNKSKDEFANKLKSTLENMQKKIDLNDFKKSQI